VTGAGRLGEVWLGIDLGTQGVRAVAYDADGHVAGEGATALDSSRAGPRHEQDPGQWWRAVAGATRQALAAAHDPPVRGVAVDSTSGTVLLVDDAGHALTPALMYDDSRAVDLVERVNEVGGGVWAQLGYQRMQASWALPKLLWLLAEHPDARNGRLAHQTDVVNRRLVGHAVPTDLASALKTGAHLLEEAWPAEVMEELGVPAHVLPELVRSGTVIGAVCPAAAESTGIPAGTPVVAGTTDGCAAQLGAGALAVGSWNSVLGTTLVLKGVTAHLVQDPTGAVYSHRSPDGHWLPGGASSTGAGVLTRDFAGRDLDDLGRRAATREPASALAYPLVSDGERFPFVAPGARPFLLGALDDEADTFAALLQGVAFVERLCFDHLDLLGAPVDGDLVLTGGATRSTYWCQLRADVLGRPVTLVENAQPALGAAVLAASPGRRTAEVAARMVRRSVTLEPRAGSADRWRAPFLALVEQLADRGWLHERTRRHAWERAVR
jgi:sugar (pentulose or hexulose) kinase